MVVIRRLSLSVTFLFLFISVAAFAEPHFTWEEICAVDVCRATGHDGVFNVDFAPDNKRLVVEVRHPDKNGIYLVDLKGSTQFLTKGNQPQWLPNANKILYLQNGNLQIFDLASQTISSLTEDWTDIHSPKISPNGDFVAFASMASDAHDIWLVPTKGGKKPQQLTDKAMPKDEVRLGFNWSPDSRHIAYFSNRADELSDDLWVIDVNTKQARLLNNEIMGHGEPVFSPDGKHIALYATLKTDYWFSELMDIIVVDSQNGDSRKVDMQINAREPGSPLWGKDGEHLYFPNHSRGVVELWAVKSGGGVATRLTHNGGLLHDWDISNNGKMIATVRSTPTRGRELELLSTSGGKAQTITQFATQWQGLAKPEEISYRSVDGMYIQGFVFYPPDFDTEQSYPAVIQVHGGGTHSYYNGLNLVEQRLAQLGYVVMAVNYRGGSGFGRSFQALGTNDWANTQALDAAAGAEFIRAQSWSNGKVGIYGYSYGGIISLGAVARAPKAFDAAVPMGGIYDFARAYNNENRLIRLFIRYGHSGTPEETPEHYSVSNTINRLKNAYTPILLMHGENDTIAPFDQFIQASQTLRKYNKKFEAHSYADEPHRFRQVANRVDMYTRLEAWMAHHLMNSE